MTDIAEELNDVNACDDRCRGRCEKCPNDTIREAVAEIERLNAIKTAADKAYRYHMIGYKDPTEFNANVMLDLMNELGALL